MPTSLESQKLNEPTSGFSPETKIFIFALFVFCSLELYKKIKPDKHENDDD